jgi:hypothetical protein
MASNSSTVRVAVRERNSQSRQVRGRETPRIDSGHRHPVAIEFSLWRRSPENGNIRGGSRRLSAYWPRIWRILELGDSSPNRKSPPIVGLSASFRSSSSGAGTGWLGREDSNCDMADRNPTMEIKTLSQAIGIRTEPMRRAACGGGAGYRRVLDTV